MTDLAMKKFLILFTATILSHSFLASAEDEAIGEACPSDFHQLPLFPNARLCQMFDDAFPATLTYHANVDMNEAAAFYLEQLGSTTKDAKVKGRRVLHFGDNNNPIVIISPDGQGSQVDVLMKEAL